MSKRQIFGKDGIWLLLLAAAACPTYSAAFASQNLPNRAWWVATDIDERTEFLAGYIDCATYDLGNRDLEGSQWNVIERKISYYYSKHGKARKTVPELLFLFGNVALRSGDPAPEVYPGKHGIFDGDYWYQMTPNGRVGYVEGYVDCRMSVAGGTGFGIHPASWYASRVTSFYCRKGHCDNERASEKIAFVIERLQESSVSSKQE